MMLLEFLKNISDDTSVLVLGVLTSKFRLHFIMFASSFLSAHIYIFSLPFPPICGKMAYMVGLDYNFMITNLYYLASMYWI